MKLEVQDNRICIKLESKLSEMDAMDYLYSYGIGVAPRNYREEAKQRLIDVIPFCTIDVPFAYIEGYVFIADKNMDIHIFDDIEYAKKHIPYAEFIEIDSDGIKHRTNVDSYVQSKSNNKHFKIKSINNLIELGDKISKLKLEAALIDVISLNKEFILLDIIEVAHRIKEYNDKIRAERKTVTLNMFRRSSNGNKYKSKKEYTLIDKYVGVYDENLFKTEVEHRIQLFIDNAYKYSRFLVAKKLDADTDDILKCTYAIDASNKIICIEIEVREDYLSEYQRLEKKAIESINMNNTGRVQKEFVDYAIVQFKQDAFIIKDGKLHSIDAERFVRETRCNSKTIYDSNRIPKYVNILDYNIVNYLSISSDADLILYEGMTKEQFYKSVEAEKIRAELRNIKRENERLVRLEDEKLFKDLINKDNEAYKELNKLIFKIYGPTFIKYNDSDTQYFDAIEVSFTTSVYKYTKEEKIQLIKKYKEYLDREVLERITSSERFKEAGLGLNYFKLAITLTNDNRISYRLSLKAEKILAE